MSKLLVVDDEQSICWGLKQFGESLGHEVATASSAEHALESIERIRPNVIVLDVRLPGMDGLTAMEHFRNRVGTVPVIVITAFGDLETAVQAVRNGAFEYIVKPFSLDQMESALVRALSARDQPTTPRPQEKNIQGLIGRSPAMQSVFNQIALASASDVSLLLCGESGTGKELAARAIHQYSSRSEGPFVTVHVASLSPSLAESELFGHTRGAFTGADQDRTGLLVQAHGGTLFLDEVADIPLPTQVKLLRALDHGEVLPVGSSKAIRTDFRIVSATHQNLLKNVKSGSFRHDLYYRISAFHIQLPPLRERCGDIQRLAQHFLDEAMRGRMTESRTLANETLAELERRPWHGNVRELRNAIEHGVILARGGVIEPYHLPKPTAPSSLNGPGETPPLEDSITTLIRRWAEAQLSEAQEADDLYEQLLRLVEPPLLAAALESYRGQCAAAARRLGIHRTTLRKKLDQYAISRD